MRTSEQRLNAVERAAGPPPRDWIVLLPGDPDPYPDFKADYEIHVPPRFNREGGLVDPSKHRLVTS